jgi:hypothetical protein
MERNTLIMILGIAVLAAMIYFYSTKEGYDGHLEMQPIAETPSTVEYIQGEPDYHAINSVTGMEMIPPHDISLSEGFGVSAGTFGFGRSGSTFMV